MDGLIVYQNNHEGNNMFGKVKKNLRFISKKYMRKIFIIFLLVFIQYVVNSCFYNDKLECSNEHIEGLRIAGERPWKLSFFFIPLDASSQYHIYNNISIDYKKIKSGMLDNINIYLFGKKYNLDSIQYDEVSKITTNLRCCKKIFKSHYYDWKDEKEDEISFFFFDKEYQYTYYAVRFFFESDTKKINSFSAILPTDMNNILKFENIDNSTHAIFPFVEKDLLLLFGRDIQIYKNCDW
ncbi:MAG: hypothetical protein J6X55_05285 [Victivallales bacterium]|nr:hypothetical protein [Victivallales bacterium]